MSFNEMPKPQGAPDQELPKAKEAPKPKLEVVSDQPEAKKESPQAPIFRDLAKLAEERTNLYFNKNQEYARGLAKTAGSKKATWNKESTYYKAWTESKKLLSAYTELANIYDEFGSDDAIDNELNQLLADKSMAKGENADERIAELNDAVKHIEEFKKQSQEAEDALHFAKDKLKEEDLVNAELNLSPDEKAKREQAQKDSLDDLKASEEIGALAEATKQSYSGFGGFFRRIGKVFGFQSKAELNQEARMQEIELEQTPSITNVRRVESTTATEKGRLAGQGDIKPPSMTGK